MNDARDPLKEPPPEYGETRPWGEFRRFVHDEPCTVKLITVLPGERLSLQSHKHRSEMWVFLDPGGVVEIGRASCRERVLCVV